MTRQFGCACLLGSIVLILIIFCLPHASAEEVIHFGGKTSIQYREEVREMFYHAYNGYLKHAFPFDQLGPVTCRPYTKKANDYHLGGFGLSAIESLSTLAVMGNKTEFKRRGTWLIHHLRFSDKKVVMSVFEANIRMLGGLLSAHLLIEDDYSLLPDYEGQFLSLAKELGESLLPAFRTTDGIPHKRIQIGTGGPSNSEHTHVTSLADAGTFLLEFSILSRLTGDYSYERAAKRAMNVLWSKRTRLDLLGSLIDTQTRTWKKDPNIASGGIGSGSDSFYEYLIKYYILSGDLHYYDIWNDAYAAIVKYMKNDYWYVDVDIETGLPSRNWVDSFQAFFPSLMVLAGDPANATHMYEAYHSMWRHYGLLPEVYHHASQYLHMQNYPLRPEMPESTWYLYQTTKDPYYLQVGAEIVDALNKYCRTNCGFAAIKEILTMSQEDQMDSFFLSETLKYLYLLFDTENFVNKGNYVFNTEGHLFPIKKKFMGPTPPSSEMDKEWGVDVGATEKRQRDVNRKYQKATCPKPLFFEHDKFGNSADDIELADKYYYWATAFQEEPKSLADIGAKTYSAND